MYGCTYTYIIALQFIVDHGMHEVVCSHSSKPIYNIKKNTLFGKPIYLENHTVSIVCAHVL